MGVVRCAYCVGRIAIANRRATSATRRLWWVMIRISDKFPFRFSDFEIQIGSVNSGLPIIELIVTREEFDRGYLTWGGAYCDCSSYKLIRELPDGRLLVLGRVSQDPTCQIEEWIAASARESSRKYGGKPDGKDRKRGRRK